MYFKIVIHCDTVKPLKFKMTWLHSSTGFIVSMLGCMRNGRTVEVGKSHILTYCSRASQELRGFMEGN